TAARAQPRPSAAPRRRKRPDLRGSRLLIMAVIGKSDLVVFPLGLGGHTFGLTSDKETSFAVLDGYVAGGGNFVDTADSYSAWVPGHGGGESETIIGEWTKARGNRASGVIA